MAYLFTERGVNDFIANVYSDPELKNDAIKAMQGTLSEFKSFIRDQFTLSQKQNEILDTISQSAAATIGNRVANAFENDAALKAVFGPEPGSDINFLMPIKCGTRVTHYNDCEWRTEFYCECEFNIALN
ncbi:MAG: hypothetical protein K9N34_04025 [Candidatus Marinimicrobia bacterium]|nr:hypothetical protein [Candidatus Neomarinimicrobiota bacterium]